MRLLIAGALLWNVGVWRGGMLADVLNSNAVTQWLITDIAGPILYGAIDVLIFTITGLGLAFDC